MQPMVDVRSSGIEGLGVFAAQPYPAGEVILAIDDSRVVDKEHPLGPEDDPRYCDYLAEGRTILMSYPERHINHSCDPNVYVRTVDGTRFVIALRQILTGEEITYDYCINGYGDTLWDCDCGASRCRRRIHSDFFHLPIALQREYLPLLDTWFVAERFAEVRELASH